MRNADFERLYEAHGRALLGFLELRTGDRATAEDLLADTFERVLTARRYDPRRGTGAGWLYAIALNLVRDHARRRAAESRALEREAVTHGPEGASLLPDIEEREVVMGALDQLSSDEREVVALRYGADLRLREIAKATGEKPATVEARLYRALRKLRERLE